MPGGITPLSPATVSYVSILEKAIGIDPAPSNEFVEHYNRLYDLIELAYNDPENLRRDRVVLLP